VSPKSHNIDTEHSSAGKIESPEMRRNKLPNIFQDGDKIQKQAITPKVSSLFGRKISAGSRRLGSMGKKLSLEINLETPTSRS
jgi:hypothetical protein